jgi:hypothetical protein
MTEEAALEATLDSGVSCLTVVSDSYSSSPVGVIAMIVEVEVVRENMFGGLYQQTTERPAHALIH